MRRLLGFALILVPVLCWGQPDTVWTRTYDTIPFQFACGVQETSDGGFLIAARGYGATNEDVGLIRTDANGDTLWTKTLDSGHDDRVMCLSRISDSVFLATTCGDRNSVFEFDASGDTLWCQNDTVETDLGFAGQRFCNAHCIRPCGGGLTVLVGMNGHAAYYPPHSYVEVRPYAMEMSENGNAVWATEFSNGVWPYSSALSADGGSLVAGRGDWSHTDLYVMKLSPQGVTQWSRTYGGTVVNGDNAINCVRLTNGDYAVLYIMPTGEFRLMRVLSSGDTVWTRTFPNYMFTYWTPNSYDATIDVHAMPDNGLLIAGTCLLLDSAGHYTITGQEVARLDSTGLTVWHTELFFSFNWGPPGNIGWYFCGSQVTSDGGLIVVGTFSNSHVIGLIKYAPFLPVTSPEKHHQALPTTDALHPNFPNPFNSTTEIAFDLPKAGRISLKVYDLLGREVAVVQDGMMAAGSHRVNFDGKNLASGVYVYRLQAGDAVQARKMVVLK